MSKTEHTGGRVLLALGVLLAALFILSFRLGRYGVDTGTTCRILLSRLLPLEQTWTGNEYTAVLNIRLPRIVLACLVGCCLSSAGAAYQGVFQNPMASPDVLGASSGASFGAALAILAGLGNQGTTLSAFFWSLATVVLVYLVGQRAPGDRVLNLVLAGMVISSLFTAATSYLKLVADPTNQLPRYLLAHGQPVGHPAGRCGPDPARHGRRAASPVSSCGGSSTCSPWGTMRPGPWE